MKRGLVVLAVAACSLCLPARAENPAEALLANVAAKIQRVQALSTDYTIIRRYPKTKKIRRVREFRDGGHMALMRPNLVQAEWWILHRSHSGAWGRTESHFETRSDGRTYRFLSLADNQYRQWPVNAQQLESPGDICIGGFFDERHSLLQRVRSARKLGHLYMLEPSGTQDWDGASYRTVHIVMYEDDGVYKSRTDQLVYVARDDTVRRVVQQFNIGGVVGTEEEDLENVVVDPPMAASAFHYTLPKAMQPFDDTPKPVLAGGSIAPDFTVVGADGKPVSLSDFRGQVVVLDFWATWCGPCQEALPDTNALAEVYRSKGVVFLGVSVWDTQPSFDAWLPDHKAYDAIRFAIDTRGGGKDIATSLYEVTGIPTQFVIGADGKVDYSQVGYSSEIGVKKAIDAALAEPPPSPAAEPPALPAAVPAPAAASAATSR
jgi:thiol-disulfide isomerase/thioredoxin